MLYAKEVDEEAGGDRWEGADHKAKHTAEVNEGRQEINMGIHLRTTSRG